MSKFEQPGKFFRDGLLLGIPVTPQSLEKGLSYQFTHEDVMVAGYPKSGNYLALVIYCMLLVVCLLSQKAQLPVYFRRYNGGFVTS